MVLYAGFIWWFYQCLSKIFTFLLESWTPWDATRLVCFLPIIRAKRRWLVMHLILFPNLPSFFVSSFIQTAVHKMAALSNVFSLLSIIEWKTAVHIHYSFYSIPIHRACGATLGRFPCKMHPHNQKWSVKRGGHWDSLTFPWTFERKESSAKMVLKEDFFSFFFIKGFIVLLWPDFAHDFFFFYLPTIFLSIWSQWISLILCKLKFCL